MTVLATRPEMSTPVLWRFPQLESWGKSPRLTGQHLRLEDSEMFHLAVWLPIPLAGEPRHLEGVTHLCARLLTEGTLRRDGQAFASRVDRIAASVWAETSLQGVTVRLTVPTRHATDGLRLLAEAVTEPSFPEDALQRVRREVLADIRSSRLDLSGRARIALDEQMYLEADRRSRQVAGAEASVEQIDREDVLERWRQCVATGAAQVLSVGSPTTAQVAELAGDALVALQREGGAALAQSPAPLTAPPSTVLIDRPGASQTALEIGWATGGRTDDGHAARQIAARMLGEGMRSRLNLVLREEKGYTYGVRASVVAGRSVSMWHVAGTVRADATGAALSDALTILGKFGEQGPTEAEHASATNAILCATPIQHQNGASILQSALSGVRDGLAPDWLTTHLARVAATTAEQVARHYRIDLAGRPTIAIVADARLCLPQLQEVGITVDRVLS